MQTKSHQTRKAIQPRKRVPPLRALTGPPLPKGRGSYNSNTFYIKQHSTKDPKALPLGNNKHKQSAQIKNSLSLGGEMSQRDREGRLAINIDCPTSSPPNPATAKQEPEMSRPPWGKVAGVSLTEGGNSVTIKTAYQPRHQTQRTTPTPTTQTKQHQIRKVIQSRKRAPPLRALTGPPLPKGRG